jgi:CRP/FNR family transcriptional regulator
MEGFAVDSRIGVGDVDPRINALRQTATEPICDVRAITVCKAVADADLARLATSAVVTEVPAGQGFIDEGDPANVFFVVTAGTAKLFKLLPDGRRQIIGFVGPGQFLGLAEFDTYAFSAEAIEPVCYCRFLRAKLRTLLDDFPLMEKRLLEVASDELIAAQEQLLLLGRKTARERLASYLLMQSRQGLQSGRLRRQFKLPITHRDIADYLGLTIETVSRTFTRLQAEGLIDIVSQGQMVIRDPVTLEELASGGLPVRSLKLSSPIVKDRRRPGRLHNVSPALIPILRNPVDSSSSNLCASSLGGNNWSQ